MEKGFYYCWDCYYDFKGLKVAKVKLHIHVCTLNFFFKKKNYIHTNVCIYTHMCIYECACAYISIYVHIHVNVVKREEQ
jgi:hypothetical protein